MARNRRDEVAREAAKLIYEGVVTEYIAAKRKACELLGVKVMPSNREVALALDELLETRDGERRREYTVKKRRVALSVMRYLSSFSPRLVGSVWRGLCREGSDIDIVVFSEDPDLVVKRLCRVGVRVLGVEVRGNPFKEPERKYVRITASYMNEIIDIKVKPPAERENQEVCEIFGDVVTGLSLVELESLLKRDPLKKFLPR